MKNIITAIGNEKLNNILKTINENNIKTTDIIYQEGIIETLEKYKDIDIIIINEDIIGNLEIEDLIQEIIMIKENIEIIAITTNGEKIKRIKQVVKIVDDKENYVKEVITYLNNKDYIKQEKQTSNLSKIEKNNLPKYKIEVVQEKKKVRKRFFEKKEKKKNKEIIVVIGSSGVGKTTFISILSKIVKRKILIIDFDLINNNLHSVFGVKQIPIEMKEKIKDTNFLKEFRLNEKNIEKLKVKVNKKVDLISKTNIVFDEEYIINKQKIKEMLENFKNQYDLILIDTTSDTKYRELVKTLIKISDKIICPIEGNIIQIKKTIKLLNEYIEDRKKIKLVYNKKNKYTLNDKIMKIIFLKFKIIGSLSYNEEYNHIINKSVKSIYINKTIKKEFKNIIERMQ